MRIAIFGSGGVGGYHGARLAHAGHDVTFIARGPHLEAMHEAGLEVESVKGDIHIDAVQATDDPADVGSVDVVLVATKTYHLAQAAEQMRPLITADTLVLPLLNGVEVAGQLSAALPEARVLGGVTYINSLIERPGKIFHRGGPEPDIVFGPISEEPGARVEALHSALQGSGISTELSTDIETALWLKFVAVTAFGGVGAVTRAPVGVTIGQPETRAMLAAAMQESSNVAAARGTPLPSDIVANTLRRLESLPAAATASMQRDIAAGRPSELEAWVGAVVHLGAEVGVDTPTNRFIYHSLLPQDRRAHGEIEFPT